MKKTLCLILALLFVFPALAACTPGEDAPETAAPAAKTGGTDLSSFTAAGLEGGVYSGEIFKGHKLTMLNVWGTYCGPCIREMPDLAELSQSCGDGFRIVGIVKDAADRNLNALPDKVSEARSIVSQTGAAYLHLLPSKSLYDLFLKDVQVLPTTIFLDENGVMLDEPYYGSRSLSAWNAIVAAYLEALS